MLLAPTGVRTVEPCFYISYIQFMNQEIVNLEVNNRDSFIQLLKLMQADLQQNKEDWENNKLESFLEAMGRYAEDIQGYYDFNKQNINADVPSWKVFADIMRGAIVYE